jgi:hypothetical protein
MVTQERQLDLRLVNLYLDAVELTAELGGRLAVDFSRDGGDRIVVFRDVIGA